MHVIMERSYPILLEVGENSFCQSKYLTSSERIHAMERYLPFLL